MTDSRVHEFLAETGAWGSLERQRELSAWAWRSALARPWAYAGGLVRSAQSQLELVPRRETDCGWMLWRLGEDGTHMGQVALNFQVSEDPTAIREFAMGRGETAARMARSAAKRHAPVQAALLVGAVAAGVFFVVRRERGAAVVVLGTGAYFAAHVVMLQPWSRLTVPSWACWVLFFPDGTRGVRAFVGRWRNRR
jgi:hypothetical protein